MVHAGSLEVFHGLIGIEKLALVGQHYASSPLLRAVVVVGKDVIESLPEIRLLESSFSVAYSTVDEYVIGLIVIDKFGHDVLPVLLVLGPWRVIVAASATVETFVFRIPVIILLTKRVVGSVAPVMSRDAGLHASVSSGRDEFSHNVSLRSHRL